MHRSTQVFPDTKMYMQGKTPCSWENNDQIPVNSLGMVPGTQVGCEDSTVKVARPH